MGCKNNNKLSISRAGIEPATDGSPYYFLQSIALPTELSRDDVLSRATIQYKYPIFIYNWNNNSYANHNHHKDFIALFNIHIKTFTKGIN